MKHVTTIFSIAAFGYLCVTAVNAAEDKSDCLGRLYPATAIEFFPKAVRVDVDLGFELRYNTVLAFKDLGVPSQSVQSFLQWFKEVKAALAMKIGNKPLQICVKGDEKAAIFYSDGENINKWLVSKGYFMESHGEYTREF